MASSRDKKMFAFFSARSRIGLAPFLEVATLVAMTNSESLSKAQLLELLDQKVQQHTIELQTKDAELQSQREQLREQDIAIQTKDQTIEQLTQERDDYKLAYDKLMQQRFRNRSERYIDNPDQLRLD
jgi:Skp family chaperone for outer membrane proteins